MRSEAKRIGALVPDSKWYLFGSCILTDVVPSDIDLLVVYSQAEDSQILRNHLRSNCDELPLHLLLLSQTEEAELNFVASEGCAPFRSRKELGEGS